MKERRTGNRYFPSVELEVFNPLRRQRIGNLVDLSDGGVQIRCDVRLNMEEETLYWIRLPAHVGRRRWVALSGRVVWRHPDRRNGGFAHGIRASQTCQDQLQRLLEQVTHDNNTAAHDPQAA